MRPLQPGDRIKLTGKHLRDTGQLIGSAGQRVWTVVSCTCGLCARDFVAVDQPSAFGEGPRHFNVRNVYRAGTLDARNVS